MSQLWSARVALLHAALSNLPFALVAISVLLFGCTKACSAENKGKHRHVLPIARHDRATYFNPAKNMMRPCLSFASFSAAEASKYVMMSICSNRAAMCNGDHLSFVSGS